MRTIILTFLCLLTLSSWSQEKDSIVESKLFRIRSYKPIYFLIANHTNRVNFMPTSGNPLNNVPNRQALDGTELKFQLSFKAKVWHIRKIFGMQTNASIWLAYTQTSRWQFYNTDESRPFRETNYEPEAFVTVPFDSDSEKWKGAFWGFGINHQSNGRSLPFSRSWNRLIFQLGIEKEHYSVVLRPWWRVEEEAFEDDNPNVQDFVGRFDLTSVYKKGDHNLSLILRHSLRNGTRSRGSFRFSYAYQLFGYFKINAQVFSGYGESLLDYNHRQTTFGIGFSLVDWLDKF
jgi:phospholipase A1